MQITRRRARRAGRDTMTTHRNDEPRVPGDTARHGLEWPPARDLLDHLVTLGYVANYREQGFVECLLSRELERFVGRGVDREAALEDALRAAFPSAAARHLAAVALRAGAPPTANEARAEPATRPPPHATAPDPLPVPPPVAAPTPVADSPRNGVPRSPGDGEEAPAPPPAPRPPPVPRLALAEAEVRMAALDTEIAFAEDELPALAPSRQRLVLLALSARMRDLQLRCSDRVVERHASDLAHRLSELTGRLWCGSIVTLKREATPRDAAIALPPAFREPLPSTWSELSERAAAALAALDDDDSHGFDEDGFADTAALSPPPPAPRRMLRQVVAAIEERCGPIDSKPLREERSAIERSVVAEPERWIEIARRIRWLRGTPADPWLWGLAIGRLRFVTEVALRSAPPLGDRLFEILDAAARPTVGWAKQLGEDPADRERARQRASLLAEAPRAGSDDSSFSAWLFRVLDDSDLPLERIVAAIPAELRERLMSAVIEPPEGAVAQRRHTRRLSKLKELLVAPQRAIEARVRALAPDAVSAGGLAEPSAEQEDPDWLAEVVATTRGRRALLLCNRADPAADAAIEDALELAELERVEQQVRRVQAVCERIRERRYDFVLSATGFQSHAVEDHVRDACRHAGVPYVRVNRARKLTVLRALAREQGLLAGQRGAARS
jgi:hypothetical protein